MRPAPREGLPIVISDERSEESLLEGGGALMQPLEHASTLSA
jgi:hypothetical protein